ncbi:Xaa-Pro aminopeptidase [Neptunicella marina]|uniref:Xaa-Pro aminopeptidase n=1 Tax=Neptunicella marina TaxID=2125989 RepID=A0A8J6LZW6_9ALTE|nr:Xaa-Pro aminopeptidase [Neptunicella marina]MBC3766854.1 Xaa-Pro aminopeptidase [Neptunicella marina]
MDKSVFFERRQRVIGQLAANSVMIIPAAREVTRSRDTEYPFRQDSYFYYLTGFNEPDAWLVLSNSDEHEQHILYCRDKDPQAEIWQGIRLGPEQAEIQLGIEAADALEQFEEQLSELLNQKSRLYYVRGVDNEADELIFSCLDMLQQAARQGMSAPTQIEDWRPMLDDMRLIKDQHEIALMQKAADISVLAHQRAMQSSQAGKMEYQLEADILHEFASHGARYPAYSTIVGSGGNACILHYTNNDSELKNGDLVLIDAGAEYQGYAADITRTFPVNGRFTPEQKELYQLVLSAQQAAFEQVKPDSTMVNASEAAVKIITQGLLDLGILSGELQDNIEQQSYRDFFMHGIGHWLGLDVHDVGSYKVNGDNRPLKPGMVLTIEPGIYISQTAEVDAKWRGIGIRIEDNLLVTDEGHINLTQAAPKSIVDIETLMEKRWGEQLA